MRVIVKEPNEDFRVVSTDIKYVGDLKSLIGTNFYPETVYLGGNTGLYFCADEDGYPKGSEFNIFLPTLSYDYPVQRLVGTIVFYRVKPIDYCGEIYDYEVGDLSDCDISVIADLLQSENQKQLKKEFEFRYSSIDEYLKPIFRKIK